VPARRGADSERRGVRDVLGKLRGLGRRAASGGGGLRRRMGADTEGQGQAAHGRGHGVAARRRGSERGQLVFVLLSLGLNMNNFRILNRSVPNFEYESYRSHYPLQLSRKPYRVFLNRFCKKGLATLNVNLCQ
jgi:hypothetical protein